MFTDNLCVLAVTKLLEKENKGFKSAPGINDIDATITLRVKAQVVKGQDVTYTPTVDIPLKVALALVLEKSGITREAAAKILTEALTEALESGEQAEGAVAERLNDIDLALARVTAITAVLPKKIRSGATTVKGTVEELSIVYVYPVQEKKTTSLTVEAPTVVA